MYGNFHLVHIIISNFKTFKCNRKLSAREFEPFPSANRLIFIYTNKELTLADSHYIFKKRKRNIKYNHFWQKKVNENNFANFFLYTSAKPLNHHQRRFPLMPLTLHVNHIVKHITEKKTNQQQVVSIYSKKKKKN